MPKKIDAPPEHCSNVKEYEKSTWWKKKTKALLDKTDCTCAICGRHRWVWQVRKKVWKRKLNFSVHHIRYTNVPYEKDEDLLVLCTCCHKTAHELLRYERLGAMYKALADIIRNYFQYDGIDTFKKW